jgi:hypothetical protein
MGDFIYPGCARIALSVRHFAQDLLGPTLPDQPRRHSHLESSQDHSRPIPRLLLHKCFHWSLQVFDWVPHTRGSGERGAVIFHIT